MYTSCLSCGSWHRTLFTWLTSRPGLVPLTSLGCRNASVGAFPRMPAVIYYCCFYHFTFIFLFKCGNHVISTYDDFMSRNNVIIHVHVVGKSTTCADVELCFPFVLRENSATFNKKIKLVSDQMAKQMSESVIVQGIWASHLQRAPGKMGKISYLQFGRH